MARLHDRCSPDNNCCSSMRRQMGLQTLWELGQGGQGTVFLCTDAQTHTLLLACKTIRSHASAQRTLAVVHDHPTPCQRNVEQSSKDGYNCCKRRKIMNDIHDADADKIDVPPPPISSRRKLSTEEVWEDFQLRWEAEVLQHLSGIPGILPLVSTFEGDDSCFHLVTAFCDKGDLLSKLDSHPPLFTLPQHEAAPIVASLARTLASCHARGVTHRDIKAGNILFRRLAGIGEDGEEVLLADFGLASAIAPGETLHERVGTPRYQAPEVIQGRYDHRADIWSLGVVIHLLLTCTMPFTAHIRHDAPDAAIHHAILCNELQLEGLDLSASAQDLLRGILCKDPNARLTLKEILCHPWLLGHHNGTEPATSTAALSKQRTKRARTAALPKAGSLTPSPDNRHGVLQHNAVDSLDKAESISAPKITRVRLPMGRKCFRQQWANVIAKAAVA